MPLLKANRTGLRGELFFSHFIGNACGQNPCWHGNDTIPEQHDERCKHFTQRCNGRNVSIPNSGKGYNSPVNALRDAAERIVYPVLYHKHERACNDGDKDHGEKEYQYFSARRPKGVDEKQAFIKEMYHFKYPENPE